MTEARAAVEAPPEGMRVVVVGAGIIGLSCAYVLARNGFRPIVIDASASAGSGASWGNGGLIAFAPEIVAPVPAPGVLRTSLRWLVQRDSPLRISLRPRREYLLWLAGFIASCSRARAAAGLDATMVLNAETGQLFDELLNEGLDFEM